MVDTNAAHTIGEMVDLNQQRLDLADTRGFTAPGAGPARRLAIAALGRRWLTARLNASTHGARHRGVPLARVGNLAPGAGDPPPHSRWKNHPSLVSRPSGPVPGDVPPCPR